MTLALKNDYQRICTLRQKTLYAHLFRTKFFLYMKIGPILFGTGKLNPLAVFDM
jgi:hypothetical protein